MGSESTPPARGKSGYDQLAGGFAAGQASQSRNAELAREYRRTHPGRGRRILDKILRRHRPDEATNRPA